MYPLVTPSLLQWCVLWLLEIKLVFLIFYFIFYLHSLIELQNCSPKAELHKTLQINLNTRAMPLGLYDEGNESQLKQQNLI